MGLQQFERRLERMVEGVFARAFRSSLQPVEIGRRLTREMDLRRTMAPRGTLTPNQFTVLLSPSDRNRFSPIEGELVSELEEVARDHAKSEHYVLLGPVSVTIQTDDDLAGGTVLVSGEMAKAGPDQPGPAQSGPAPSSPAPAYPAPSSPAPAYPAPSSPAPAYPAPSSSAPAETGPADGILAQTSLVAQAHGARASLVLPDGRRVELGTKPLVVGRLPDSGLVLTDPNVSRYHAEIRLALDATSDLRAPEYEVADMGSTNGSKVNGVPIIGSQVLRDGDMVTVGATTIRFERA